MIQEFEPQDFATVDAISEPKHVWWNIDKIIVYTGDDIPKSTEENNVE